MKKSRFSESQIVGILKEAEAGVGLDDLICQHGFSKASFYKWKAKYSGMSVNELKRLKELEEENRRLKQMCANLSLEHEALKEIIEKNSKAGRTSRVGEVCDGAERLERAPGLSSGELESQCLPLSSQEQE